jgi:2',3'-cyclic-nucleotide 3'-phosphodiesterase
MSTENIIVEDEALVGPNRCQWLTESSSTLNIRPGPMSVSLSLWLVPPDPDIERISKCMKSLHPTTSTSTSTTTKPSPNSFPTFTPHVTLLTIPTHPADALSTTLDDLRAAVVSASTNNASNSNVVTQDLIPISSIPIPIKFASLETGSHFYRSVYIVVHDETGALRTLHASVHEAMKLEPRTPRFPHLSLCYIDDADAQLREEVARNALTEGYVIVPVEGTGSTSSVRLRYGPQEEEWIEGFECWDIWIVQCGSKIQEWRVLEKIRLANT